MASVPLLLLTKGGTAIDTPPDQEFGTDGPSGFRPTRYWAAPAPFADAAPPTYFEVITDPMTHDWSPVCKRTARGVTNSPCDAAGCVVQRHFFRLIVGHVVRCQRATSFGTLAACPTIRNQSGWSLKMRSRADAYPWKTCTRAAGSNCPCDDSVINSTRSPRGISAGLCGRATGAVGASCTSAMQTKRAESGMSTPWRRSG